MEKGFSLIESLMVIVIVGVIILLLANIPNALNLMTKARHLSLAREIAAKQIEDKRSVNYSNLTDDTLPINDSRINSLPSGSGTVTVADCDLSVCYSDEPVKQITINISWMENNKQQTVNLKTFIGQGGLNQ